MSIENTEIGQNKTDYQGLVTKWQEESDLFTRQGLAGDEIWVTCADELAEVIARNVQPSPDDQKIESMTFATEPCPDCGSRHHRSCEARPVQQPAPNEIDDVLLNEVIADIAYAKKHNKRDSWLAIKILDRLVLREGVQQPATEPDERECSLCEGTGSVVREDNKLMVCPDCDGNGVENLALRDVPQGPDAMFHYWLEWKKEIIELMGSYECTTRMQVDMSRLMEKMTPSPRQVPVGPEGKK